MTSDCCIVGYKLETMSSVVFFFFCLVSAIELQNVSGAYQIKS